jgi:phospholipid/cholesterol/gamma-HCH transport system substrate-binding protein
METRARYLLIGLFLCVVALSGFFFVYWLNNSSGFGARTAYRVAFQGPAYGLLEGSAVLFNGIKVGEVTQLTLDAAAPGQVVAYISVVTGTPVAADTKVGVESLSLMGTPSVALNGGAPGAPLLTSTDGEPPLLISPPEASQDIMRAAKTTLLRIDGLIAKNEQPITDAIANVKTFAEALGRNAGKVDKIADGLSGMFGNQEKKPTMAFDLSPADKFASLGALPDKQLAIAQPTVMLSLDSQKIQAEAGGKTSQIFPDAQWSDNLPKVVLRKLIQSFENAKFDKAESEDDAFTSDAKLVTDIRSFYVTTGDAKGVEVAVTAKLLVDGKVTGSQTFQQTRPADIANADAVAAAFDEAFKQVAADMVVWTLGLL